MTVEKDSPGNRRELIRQYVQNRNSSHTAARFDTSDIIQEAEFQLWQSGIDSLESEETSVDRSLLATISRGTLARFVRDHRRKKRDSASERPLLATPIESKEISPNHVVEARELAELVRVIVSEMDELDQRIHFLRFHCDATFTQIQEKTGLSRRKLNTRFNNIKQYIRNRLNSCL